MDDAPAKGSTPTLGKRARWTAKVAWLLVEHVFDLIADTLAAYGRIVRREAELFAGVALSLIGLLHFGNGKNCDGNTADYLSCTHPSTYYYYGWLEIALIIIGAFLILIWVLRPRRKGA